MNIFDRWRYQRDIRKRVFLAEQVKRAESIKGLDLMAMLQEAEDAFERGHRDALVTLPNNANDVMREAAVLFFRKLGYRASAGEYDRWLKVALAPTLKEKMQKWDWVAISIFAVIFFFLVAVFGAIWYDTHSRKPKVTVTYSDPIVLYDFNNQEQKANEK